MAKSVAQRMQVIDPIALFPEMKASHDAMFAGVLKIGRRKSIRVLSIEDASFAYQAERDMSGEGGSSFPDGDLTIGVVKVVDGVSSTVQVRYRVSYNGKVWAWKPEGWQAGDVPVFNPYEAGRA